MQKLLISLVCGASLALVGCSTTRNALDSVGAAIPDALARTPLMYRPDLQQGNVVTQDQVSQLVPGMSKSQVRFLLGTPMVMDPFHQDRWDYVYTMRKGNGHKSHSRVSVFFVNDRLARAVGDFKPESKDEAKRPPKEQVVEVPDYRGGEKGIITDALQKVGIEGGGKSKVQDKDKAKDQVSGQARDQAKEPANDGKDQATQ